MTNDRLKILVVDDEPDICWFLEESLKSKGHEVVKAESGTEARRIIKEDTFDLAFLDIRLPDDNGIKIADLIKKVSRATEVVLISGYYMSEGDAEPEGLNRYELITKPFDLKDVDWVVERVKKGLPSD